MDFQVVLVAQRMPTNMADMSVSTEEGSHSAPRVSHNESLSDEGILGTESGPRQKRIVKFIGMYRAGSSNRRRSVDSFIDRLCSWLRPMHLVVALTRHCQNSTPPEDGPAKTAFTESFGEDQIILSVSDGRIHR